MSGHRILHAKIFLPVRACTRSPGLEESLLLGRLAYSARPALMALGLCLGCTQLSDLVFRAPQAAPGWASSPGTGTPFLAAS